MNDRHIVPEHMIQIGLVRLTTAEIYCKTARTEKINVPNENVSTDEANIAGCQVESESTIVLQRFITWHLKYVSMWNGRKK